MKSWMRERDLLIQQTMEFVNSVASIKVNPAQPTAPAVALTPARKQSPVASPTISISVGKLLEPDKAFTVAPGAVQAKKCATPAPLKRFEPMPSGSVRDEVASRVAMFKAHQLKLQREREAQGDAILSDARGLADIKQRL